MICTKLSSNVTFVNVSVPDISGIAGLLFDKKSPGEQDVVQSRDLTSCNSLDQHLSRRTRCGIGLGLDKLLKLEPTFGNTHDSK